MTFDLFYNRAQKHQKRILSFNYYSTNFLIFLLKINAYNHTAVVHFSSF